MCDLWREQPGTRAQPSLAGVLDEGPLAASGMGIADDRGRGENGQLPGRPEDIVEQLKAVEKRYTGLDRVISQRIFQCTGSPEPFANQAILYRGANTRRHGRRNLEPLRPRPQTVGGDGQ